MTPDSSDPRSFTVGLIQMAVSADSGENLARAVERVNEAASRGADVICLPELFRTRYFCQSQDESRFDLAEPVPGLTTEALAEVARQRQVAVIAPVFERRAAGVYHNSAVVIDAGGEVAGLYRKMHVPDDPSFYEKYYFTPGDLGFRAFDVRAGRVAPLICWDQWFPEAARLAALEGASVLFYPTAIGWLPEEKEAEGDTQIDAWRTVQRGHAIANGVYVAAVNRVGFEAPEDDGLGIEFWGRSFLCDPRGVILASASSDREEIVIGEVEQCLIEHVRRGWPFLRDRRIDAYAGLERRFLGDPPGPTGK